MSNNPCQTKMNPNPEPKKLNDLDAEFWWTIMERNTSLEQAKKTWYFTIEHGIQVTAYTYEEAETIFRNIYGQKPPIGIIKPYDNSDGEVKNDE